MALRLALAHAGAGRLDVATRLLERAAQAGGRSDDGRMGELASITEAALLAGARQTTHARGDGRRSWSRGWSRTPLPDVAGLVVVRSPACGRSARGDASPARRRTRRAIRRISTPVDGAVGDPDRARGRHGAHPAAPAVGRGPARPTPATVMALVLGDERASARLVTRDVVVGAGGDGVELQWNGESLL